MFLIFVFVARQKHPKSPTRGRQFDSAWKILELPRGGGSTCGKLSPPGTPPSTIQSLFDIGVLLIDRIINKEYVGQLHHGGGEGGDG